MVEIDATIDIDFRDGTIEGDFEFRDVSRMGMVTMLEAVAQKLRDTAGEVAFVNYDCGTVRIG